VDIKQNRKDFPILLNQDLIYLDSATSTLIPTCVIEAIKKFYETNGAVTKRGVYKFTIEATEQYQKARMQVAEFFHVAAEETIFVPNESYGISSLLLSLPWKRGNRIITSYLEHHSNYLPLLYLASRFGTKIDHIAHDTDGQINPESLVNLVTPETKLISLTYSPLLFGTVSPVKEIVEIAHDKNIPVLVDGTHIAGHLPIDLKSTGCDFFICHGNIGLMGPMGIGVLYINQNTQVKLNPLILGSGTVSKVTESSYQLMDFPDKFEPGNPNVANAIGLGTAVNYLKGIGLGEIRNHEVSLMDLMISGLNNIEKVIVYGPADSSKKIGIVGFNIADLNAHDVAMYLDEAANIAVRSGLLCSHPMLERFKLPGVVQASLHLYNDEADINQFLHIVTTIAKDLT
jgi:cysteine desulfurase/selenocysteine lyase